MAKISNSEILEKVVQSGAYIQKMFFIPMCADSGELREFLEDMDCNESLFPKISEKEWEEHHKTNELPLLLINYGFMGWILEIAVPHRSNFRFRDDGVYTSCSVHPGYRRHEYVYCETFEEIVTKIEEVGEKVLQDDIKEYKKEKSHE